MRNRVALAAVLFATACATQPRPPCDPGLALVNATLYMQSAAEYKAAARQTYAAARNALDAALAEPSTQPAAIIVDLDETVFDNSRFAVRSIQRKTTFRFDEAWSAWVAESASDAIPGAVEFLQYAVRRGVTPFYITNRTSDMDAATRRNLERLGIPVRADTLMLRDGDSTDKTARRAAVESTHRVLLVLGDDLNDFTSARGSTVAQRDEIIRDHAELWGTKWFIVPNAIYDSWESAVTGSDGSPCDRLQKKLDALKP